jgi:hypothetical protein
MNASSSSTSPPAYEEQAKSLDPPWMIRNAQVRSIFTTNGEPGVQDYRTHLQCLKYVLEQSSDNVGVPKRPVDVPHVLDVQYIQVFSRVARLMSEYQACLRDIQPLQEEDILYLLLDRFSQASGAGVYLEIRRQGDVQIYDSDMSEPQVR